MNGSPPRDISYKEEEEEEEKKQQMDHSMTTRKRLCDYCNDSTALLYCRADSAKLCFSCDQEVHSANQLFTKHARSQLCDVCDDSPASIFCSTESCVLCQNCDWERHSISLSPVHDRRPLEEFTGCPSLTELLTIFGFEDVSKKALLLSEESGVADGFVESGLDGSQDFVDGFSDLVLWNTPSVVSLDDLVASNSAHSFQAMGIPPLPKNRNAACGQHKAEVLNQLRKLAKMEPNLSYENVTDFQPLVSEQNLQPGSVCTGFEYDAEPNLFPRYETRQYQPCTGNGDTAVEEFNPETSLRSFVQESHNDCDKHSDTSDTVYHISDGHIGNSQNHTGSKFLPDYLKVAPHELRTQDRETAISRYKEKKKTRRYEKHIRYQSRKARAESRIRIKGRFAKADP
ncbi:hypothetical protein FEM48_Zijuj09G0028800 [Ziziphus jujuba var. spinosa]|uniref:Zinc finger protein CONSTANS-LIKE 13 n=1 Tax=Ziziphus jujuba var. spinosa TaxID=714518 RepID=A0A978UQH2_ZIZJJ|nr:hypothetical protein FEM48_Zijuj09G0028800 [Ziziphus jujuba var. spinosa]